MDPLPFSSYFSLTTNQHSAKNFYLLSIKDRSITATLTIFAIILTLPLAGIGGLAAFRYFVRVLCPKDDSIHETTEKIAQQTLKQSAPEETLNVASIQSNETIQKFFQSLLLKHLISAVDKSQFRVEIRGFHAEIKKDILENRIDVKEILPLILDKKLLAQLLDGIIKKPTLTEDTDEKLNLKVSDSVLKKALFGIDHKRLLLDLGVNFKGKELFYFLEQLNASSFYSKQEIHDMGAAILHSIYNKTKKFTKNEEFTGLIIDLENAEKLGFNIGLESKRQFIHNLALEIEDDFSEIDEDEEIEILDEAIVRKKEQEFHETSLKLLEKAKEAHFLLEEFKIESFNFDPEQLEKDLNKVNDLIQEIQPDSPLLFPLKNSFQNLIVKIGDPKRNFQNKILNNLKLVYDKIAAKLKEEPLVLLRPDGRNLNNVHAETEFIQDIRDLESAGFSEEEIEILTTGTKVEKEKLLSNKGDRFFIDYWLGRLNHN